MLPLFLIFVLSCNAQYFPKFDNISWVVIEDSSVPEFTIVMDISACPQPDTTLYFDNATETFYDFTCTDPIMTLAEYSTPGVNIILNANPADYINANSSCRYFYGNSANCNSPALITCTYGCAANSSVCVNNVNTYEPDCCDCPSPAVSTSTCLVPSVDTIGPGALPYVDICGSVVLSWYGGCGDNIVSGSEECDGTDHCQMDCTCMDGSTSNPTTRLCEYCGDGIHQPYLGEDCETTTDPVMCNSLTCKCTLGEGNNVTGVCEYCGDGIFQPPREECELASLNCQADCLCASGYTPDGSGNCVTLCGNGVLDAGEECDPGIDNSCLPTCFCPTGSTPDGVGGCEVCGDGKVSTNEYCDDRHCNANCTACEGTAKRDEDTKTCILCGNGVVDAGEACDIALDQHCDVDCLSCRDNRVSNAAGACVFCGNGVVDSGETCDGPGCKSDCTGCQDGFVVSNGVCTTCGNGKIDNGEACDTALAPSGGQSNCKADCSSCETNYVRGLNNFCSLCGNGVVDAGESCDGTGCKADCSGCFASFTLEGTTCTHKEDESVDPNDNNRPSAIVSSASLLSFVPFSLLGLYYFLRI